jgi:hypothetical protein
MIFSFGLCLKVGLADLLVERVFGTGIAAYSWFVSTTSLTLQLSGRSVTACNRN